MEQPTLELGAAKVENEERKRGRPKGKGKPSDLRIEELNQFVGAVEKIDRRTLMGKRDYALSLILAHTAMRRAEICELKRDGVIDNGQDKILIYRLLKQRIKPGEEQVYNEIIIPNHVYEAVISYMAATPGRLSGDAVFWTLKKYGPYKERPLTPWALWKLVKKYAAKAGLIAKDDEEKKKNKRRISTHSFRATFPTLRAEDHDSYTLGSFGWTKQESMTVYVRRVKERQRAAANDPRLLVGVK